MVNAGLGSAYSVRCFAAKRVHPIANVSDCGAASRRVLHGPSKFKSLIYREPKSWSVKSCGVWFGPEDTNKGVGEMYSRFEIFNAVNDVIRGCVNEKNGMYLPYSYGYLLVRFEIGLECGCLGRMSWLKRRPLDVSANSAM